jgi:hypothetical protein
MASLFHTLQPAKIERFSMEGVVDGIPPDVGVALAGIFAQSSLQTVRLWSWSSIRPSTFADASASCRNVFVRCFEMGEASTSEQGKRADHANTFVIKGDDDVKHSILLPSIQLKARYVPALERFALAPLLKLEPGVMPPEDSDPPPSIKLEAPDVTPLEHLAPEPPLKLEAGDDVMPPEHLALPQPFKLEVEDDSDVTPLEHLVIHANWGGGGLLLRPEISCLINRVRELEIFEDALIAVHLCSTTLTHLTVHEISVYYMPSSYPTC